MASSTMVVVAHVYSRADQTENILSILRKLTEATRTEPGCIKYELHQDISDETHFTFIEEWTNEEALQLHFQAEHFKQATEQVKAAIDKPVEIIKYKKLF
jgi:quinol monooxygenase YgiN